MSKTARLEPEAPGFGILLRKLAVESGHVLDPEPAPLGCLPYPAELELKNRALRDFWQAHRLPDAPARLVPSPLPRHYRFTSKRRLVYREGWQWDFFSSRKQRPDPAREWILESQAHQAVYRRALEKLREPPYQSLARVLNFLIVRGEADLTVLINVRRLGSEVVRKAKLLAGHLAGIPEAKVRSAHLFFDPSGSDYYLEAGIPEGPFRWKRLFGPEFLSLAAAGRRYFLPPGSFFQVNHSMLPRLVEDVCRSLKPDPRARVLDLFCGVGLFTLPLAEFRGEVVGVEMAPESCEAARKAAAAAGASHVRIRAGKIETKRLPRLLPPAGDKPEILLLDPPAQGTAPGLIRALAERKPRRVVHLFCNLDNLPSEIGRWRKHGYMVAKAQPYDMFPGTDNVEMLVLLLPDRFGLLGRKRPGGAAGGKRPERF